MLEKCYCLFIAVLIANFCIAQNHVINGGFESYSTCPAGIGDFEKATNWINPTEATPDYFNVCGSPNGLGTGVPYNSYFGYRIPHGGNAYAGLYNLVLFQNYREYIEGELAPVLTAGQCYHFEMFIGSAEHTNYTSDAIAVSFLNSAIDSLPITTILSLTPAVSNPAGVFPDTLNWLRVSGDFTAAGGEKYFMIGNFKTTASSAYQVVNSSGTITSIYTQIDDVSVTPCQPQACATISNTNVTLCESVLPYLWNGNICHASGNFYSTLTNSVGCDSTVNLNLTVMPSPHSLTTVSICPTALPYTWNGNSFNAAGTYNIILPTGNGGCDSIATLNLLTLFTPMVYTGASVCPSELPYNWHGNNYDTTGFYTLTYTGQNGCDSFVILNLHVLPALSSNTNIAICASAFPYTWNGNSYNVPGIYSVFFPVGSGCDSVATLNIYTLPVATSNSQINICPSALPYIWNGNSYNATGAYNVTLTANNGCDSIATLNLIVLPTSTSNTQINICSSALPFMWNGNNYNASGTYNVMLISNNGCDSVAILVLNATPAPVVQIDTIHGCGTIHFHGIIYSFSAAIRDTLRGISGCDSIYNVTTLIISPYIQVTLTANPPITALSSGQSLLLTASVAIMGNYIYKWTKNGNVIANMGNTLTVNAGEGGDYAVMVSDVAASCSAISNVVSITDECLVLNNAFTPNGDGINDLWILYQFVCFKKLEVNVYNRYGALVYHSYDYKNNWNGKYMNKDLPDGTYYFVVKVILYNAKEYIYKNTVTILR